MKSSKTLSSLSLKAKRMEEEKEQKMPDKKSQTPLIRSPRPVMARSRQEAQPDRAQSHGRAAWHGVTVPIFWPACPDFPWGARPCTPVARPCFALFSSACYSWCSGLPRTFILLLNPPECYLFQQKSEGSP